MAVVPFVFANSTGPIPLSELDVNFANVKAFAETAGSVTSNVQANITQVGTLTSLTVTGNVTAPNFVGNVVGNIVVAGANTEILFNDNGIANSAAGLTFTKLGNLLTVNGNISANGAITTNAVIDANTLVVSSGVIGVPAGQLNFFLANNVPTTMYIGGHASNLYLANVNSVTRIAGNVSVGGNVVGANVLTTGIVSLSGNLIAGGNITGGNVLTTGIVSLSGNLIAGGNTALSGNATAATAANGTSTTQIATTAFVTNTVQNRIPAGVIVMWSGSIASIPTGWALCDGGNSTPDLRDRFLVGAGSTYAVAATGGSANAVVVSHTHTASSVVSDPGHAHNYNDTNLLADYFGTGSNAATQTTGTTTTATTGITVATTVNSTGSSATNANLPPYYALAYIMKL
jgi:hypothetical protein